MVDIRFGGVPITFSEMTVHLKKDDGFPPVACIIEIIEMTTTATGRFTLE